MGIPVWTLGPGMEAEADGFCPYCGLRAHPFLLVQHTWKHRVPPEHPAYLPARRRVEVWDWAGLLVMLLASLGLIAYAVFTSLG